MKRATPSSTMKAHVIRAACYLLLLLALCVIPFARGQRNSPRTRTRATSANAIQVPAISSNANRDAGALPTSESPTGCCLWNQYDNPATEPPVNIGSQQFEPAMAAFNDQAADD